MSDLCVCGDSLKDHGGGDGRCLYCACRLFDDAEAPAVVVTVAEPDPVPPPDFMERCKHCRGAKAVSGLGACGWCKGVGVVPAGAQCQCRGCA